MAMSMALCRRRLTPAQALTATASEIEEEVRHIREAHDATIKDPVSFDQGANLLYEDLLKSVILGFAFDFHRQLKTGELDLINGLDDLVKSEHTIVDEVGLDVFGQPPIKKPPDCECPKCHRHLTAARFAPHLEKCMGMGRNSSRIAQRRIANNSNTAMAVVGEDPDDVDDADWTMGSERRRSKKKDKTGSRRIKTQKTSRNGNSNHSDGACSNEMNVNYEGMAAEEKRNLLLQICGVISEHTKRLCTRSMRCPQHSEEQRRAVRASLLATDGTESNSDPVDVDTYEEGDAQNMRDSLGRNWEREHSTASSPADSCSTGSSTQSSKRKEKSLKNKIRPSSKKSHHVE